MGYDVTLPLFNMKEVTERYTWQAWLQLHKGCMSKCQGESKEIHDPPADGAASQDWSTPVKSYKEFETNIC